MADSKIRDNLQHLMRRHGNLRISELARAANVPQPTLHHIMSGNTKNPRRKSLHALAAFFEVSVSQLLGSQPLSGLIPPDMQEEFSITALPMISWHDVSKWPNYTVNESPAQRQIVTDDSISKQSFALAIEDEQSTPLFPAGAIVIFDPAVQPRDRNFALVYFGEENEVQIVRVIRDNEELYVKRFAGDDESSELISLKPYKDRLLATAVEVRTRVVEV